MKQNFFLLVIILCTTILKAQMVGDGFGRLSAAEIDMKECPFDPEASAVVLLDKGSANYNDNYGLMSDNHMRIKVLKQDGLKYADVSIPYHSDDQFEFLTDVEAVTINIDENGNRQEFRVEKKAIFFKKINEYASEMTFAFPQVKVGSILEYKYRSVMKSYSGLRDWSFQSRIPVCFSSYDFRPAPNLEFTYEVQKNDNYPIVVKRSEGNGVIYFEMKDIPGLGNEPYMDAREDYVQKVRFQITRYEGRAGIRKYMSSWSEVGRQLSSHASFGSQLKVNLPEDQQLLLTSIASKTDMDKMRIIHDYIRQNFQWNGFPGIYADPGLKAVYNKRTGNASAINFALINLLKEAKLEAYPMIVSERGHGKINIKTPFLKQFNNTYAAVFIDGQPYYLDATDAITPCNLIPFSILNTHALIIKRNTGVLAEIKEEKLRYQGNIYINSVLSNNGSLTGDVQMMSKNYARANRLSRYNGDVKDYINNMIKGTANLEIDSFVFTNKETDTLPLEEKFSFRTGVQTTGDYAFLNLNLFTGYESSPFITKERFSNINFGYNKMIVLNNVIRLPSEYVVDALPKNLRLVNSDKTVIFVRELIHMPEQSQVIARIKIEFNKSLYTADEYPDVKEFFKKMIDLLNEQVVLKKK